MVGHVLHGLLQHFSASAESPTSDFLPGLLHAQRCSPAFSSSSVNTVLHPQLLQLLQVVVVVGHVLHGLLQHFSASAESPTSDFLPGLLPHAQRCSPAASSSLVRVVLHPQLEQLLQVVVGHVLHELQHFSASAEPISVATIPIVMLHSNANDINLFIVYPFF